MEFVTSRQSSRESRIVNFPARLDVRVACLSGPEMDKKCRELTADTHRVEQTLSADFRRLESKVDVHLTRWKTNWTATRAPWNPNSKCTGSSPGNNATRGLTPCCSETPAVAVHRRSFRPAENGVGWPTSIAAFVSYGRTTSTSIRQSGRSIGATVWPR
jgi:hypothetical protein